MPRLEVRGLDRWLAALSDAPAILREEVEEGAERGLEHLRRDGAHYPSPRPGQRYQRTYELRRGWLEARPRARWSEGEGISLSLDNPVPWAKWVQGTDTQAWMHKRRWWTVDEIMARNEAAVRGELETALQRAAHRITSEAR